MPSFDLAIACILACSDPSVIITEIMYNPASNERGGATEWVEIANVTDDPVEIAEWRLDDEDGRDWGPFSTLLPPRGVAVLVNARHVDERGFREAWDRDEGPPQYAVIPVRWSSLANAPTDTDEILRLVRPDGTTVCEVNFECGGDWPDIGRPDGASIWLDGPGSGSLSDGTRWQRSLAGRDGAWTNNQTTIFDGMDAGSPGWVPGLTVPVTPPEDTDLDLEIAPDDDVETTDQQPPDTDDADRVDRVVPGADMKYRQLGMWGIRLSEVGFGSWLTFNDGDQDLANTLHRDAYELGINFFDTANVYGRGQTETMVGIALQPFRRDTIVLATKVFWPFDPEWPFPEANDRGLSRKHIFEQCDASLRRLQTDYIDVYQCHRYDESTPLFETCRAMSDLVDHGKVLYWGVSEWNAEQIAAAVALCDEHGWHRPVSNQPLYNMLERHWEDEVFPTCARLGMGIVNFSPLCEGLLTGKYLDGIPEDSRAANESIGQFIKPRLTEDNLAIVRKLKEIADGLGVTMAGLSLAWCLHRPELTSVIIGASKPEQVRQNAAASDIELDDTVLDHIRAILGS